MSGHSGASIALYLSLALMAQRIRQPWLRVSVTIVLFVLPLLAAYSRLYRGCTISATSSPGCSTASCAWCSGGTGCGGRPAVSAGASHWRSDITDRQVIECSHTEGHHAKPCSSLSSWCNADHAASPGSKSRQALGTLVRALHGARTTLGQPVDTGRAVRATMPTEWRSDEPRCGTCRERHSGT